MSEPDKPDSGGNRPIDYISMPQFEAADESLESKKIWADLTEHEIAVLRHRASRLGLLKDIVDKADRLDVIRCLLYHCENRDSWMLKAQARQ